MSKELSFTIEDVDYDETLAATNVNGIFDGSDYDGIGDDLIKKASDGHTYEVNKEEVSN